MRDQSSQKKRQILHWQDLLAVTSAEFKDENREGNIRNLVS